MLRVIFAEYLHEKCIEFDLPNLFERLSIEYSDCFQNQELLFFVKGCHQSYLKIFKERQSTVNL